MPLGFQRVRGKAVKAIRTALALAAALGAALPSVPAQAGDFGISEVRVGIMAHDADNHKFIDVSHVEDVNFEMLFRTPMIGVFDWLGTVRPTVGATLNLKGRESMVHAGLSLNVPLGDSGFFVEGTLGGAIHNGELLATKKGYRDLGCRTLFYQSASLGYDVSSSMNVMLTIEHASNANLCDYNRGLTDIGVRVGFKF